MDARTSHGSAGASELEAGGREPSGERRALSRGDARAAALARIGPLDADVLLAHALGITKEALYAHPEVALTGEEAARVAALVERRAGGEPVAYLRGFKEFHGLALAVDPRVLIPRPETETLVETALAFVRRAHARTVADVGTGSGAIAIALAVAEPSLRVIALDISADALALARENAARHGVADRVTFRWGDLLAPLDAPVDVVTANLPYLREEPVARRADRPTADPAASTGERTPLASELTSLASERASLAFEPAIALYAGADGLGLVRRAIADLPRVLAPRGAAFFEIDPPEADEVAALLRATVGGTVWIVPDLAGDARVVVAERGAGTAVADGLSHAGSGGAVR